MARPRFTAAQHEQMAEMREAGHSYTQIARVFGCSDSAVYWACLKLGAERPGAPLLRPRALGPPVIGRGDGVVLRRWTAEEDARLLVLANEGRGHCEIGRLMDRRHNSVRGRLMTLARHEARAEAA